MDLTGRLRSDEMAAALAVAGEVDCVLVGKLDLSAPSVIEAAYGLGSRRSLALDDVVAESLRAVVLATRLRPASQSDGGELVLAVEPCRDAVTFWIVSRHCLVGVVAPPKGEASFVTFASADAEVEFTKRQRAVARIALLQASAAGAERQDAATRRAAAAELVLGQLALPLLLVDPRGDVLFRNAAAASALAGRGGLRLAGRRLWTDRSEDRKRLDDAVAAATRATPRTSSVVSLQRDGEAPLVLCVTPARAEEPLAIVVSTTALAESPMADAVLRSFGLTLAERRLAVHFLDGRSVEDAAKAANLRKSTARSYLNRIFAKTDCSRQAELVALLTRCVPPLLPLDPGTAVRSGLPPISAAPDLPGARAI